MEALGYLPLPEANVEVKVDLSATPTAELVDQLSRAVQIPKHALRGRRSSPALIFGPDGSLSRRKSTACLCSKSVRTRRFRLIITTPLPLETGLTSGVPIENEAGYF